MRRVSMRMHIVSTLWETSAVSVIQDSLEMDTTAQVSLCMITVESLIECSIRNQVAMP